MEGNVYGLNINLCSFKLDPNLIHKNEKIRVSITTIPDEKKQCFIISPKDISNVNHFFPVNISEKTKKIIFVFRRKNMIQSDHIIAATALNENELPKSPDDHNSFGMKTVNIYEPSSKCIQNKCCSKGVEDHGRKKKIGEMEVQLQATDPFPEQEVCIKKRRCNSLKSGYSKIQCNDENLIGNLY